MSTKAKTAPPAPKTSAAKTPTKTPSTSRKSPKQMRTDAPAASGTSKLDQIVSALTTSKGVTIPDLMDLTGWQAHSVRGALAGALKVKRKLTIGSEVRDGVRFYRIDAPQ